MMDGLERDLYPEVQAGGTEEPEPDPARENRYAAARLPTAVDRLLEVHEQRAAEASADFHPRHVDLRPLLPSKERLATMGGCGLPSRMQLINEAGVYGALMDAYKASANPNNPNFFPEHPLVTRQLFDDPLGASIAVQQLRIEGAQTHLKPVMIPVSWLLVSWWTDSIWRWSTGS